MTSGRGHRPVFPFSEKQRSQTTQRKANARDTLELEGNQACSGEVDCNVGQLTYRYAVVAGRFCRAGDSIPATAHKNGALLQPRSLTRRPLSAPAYTPSPPRTPRCRDADSKPLGYPCRWHRESSSLPRISRQPLQEPLRVQIRVIRVRRRRRGAAGATACAPKVWPAVAVQVHILEAAAAEGAVVRAHVLQLRPLAERQPLLDVCRRLVLQVKMRRT